MTTANILGMIQAAGAAAQLFNLFRDNDDPMDNPIIQAQLGEQQRRQGLLDSAMNPESPEFKRLQGIHEEALKKGAVEAINESLRAHNRDRRRGGRGLFLNPERKDEALSKSLTSAHAGAGVAAGQLAKNDLLSAANVNTSLPSSAAQLYAQGDATQRARRYLIPQAFTDFASAGVRGLGMNSNINFGDSMAPRARSVPQAFYGSDNDDEAYRRTSTSYRDRPYTETI